MTTILALFEEKTMASVKEQYFSTTFTNKCKSASCHCNATKAYRGSRNMTPLILTLGTKFLVYQPEEHNLQIFCDILLRR